MYVFPNAFLYFPLQFCIKYLTLYKYSWFHENGYFSIHLLISIYQSLHVDQRPPSSEKPAMVYTSSENWQ